MKNKLILILGIICVLIPMNAKAFEDENFYKCVVDAYNETKGTSLDYSVSLTDEQLKVITDLHCYGRDITIADNLDKFPELIKLNLSSNKLTKLDVSKNEKLINLSVFSNQLISLNLKGLESLTELSASSNKLTTIDISENKALINLDLSHNQLTTIDISENKSLVNLYVSRNQLTNLDVNENTKLETLDASGNQLATIDISKNKSLTTLWLYSNQLSSLDVSNNAGLKSLYLYLNKLTSLDVSKNTKLETLYIHMNPYAKNIGVYKNNEIIVENINLVKLPESKKSTLNKITSESENIIIKDNKIKTTKAGLFEVDFEYSHNISTTGNTYSLKYNIYVIELTSDKYEINEEEGYINTKTDKDADTILNNININYGEATIKDNKLIIKYDDKIVKEFEIKNIASGEDTTIDKNPNTGTSIGYGMLVLVIIISVSLYIIIRKRSKFPKHN